MNSKQIIGILTILLARINAEIFTHLGQCCQEGKKWSIEKNLCLNYENAIENIPAVWRGLCLSTFGICCSKELNEQHCLAGRLAAKQITNCDDNKLYNTTSFMNCCKACSIGLAVATSGNNCSSSYFSYLANDDSYEICCNEMKLERMNSNDDDDDDDDGDGDIGDGANEDNTNDVNDDDTDDVGDQTFVLSENDDICGKISKLCSHICENTEDSYVCKCPDGFKLDDNRVTCTPIIENDNNNSIINIDDDDDDDDGLNEEVDNSDDIEEENHKGICPKGYEKNDLTDKCEDIDECSTGEANCKQTQYCYNMEGSFDCLNIKSTACEDGYRFNTKTEQCEDINECIEETHTCKPGTETCINLIGSYQCHAKQQILTKKCMPGFLYDVKTKKCEDFNECDDKPCEPGYQCINYPGNYECHQIIKLSNNNNNKEKHDQVLPPHKHNLYPTSKIDEHNSKCGSGYRFKHNKCIDIDECLNDKNRCDSNQVCTNEQGGYRCDCKIGFKLDGAVNACTDINECQINNHNCLPTQRCDNTIGSYTCIRLHSCGTGYTLNAETGNCEDDDECELGTHDCPNGYECRNTMGSFRCDRQRPTQQTRRTTKSTTIKSTTSKQPIKKSTTSSSTSTSTTKRAAPPKTTTTTTTTMKPSTQRLFGSPTIPFNQQQQSNYLNYNYIPTSTRTVQQRPDPSCGYGFQRNRLGACIDIDECRYTNICGSHQKCVNTNGSYRCHNLLTCSGGFKSTPDGSTCVDIDECQTGEHNCGPDQICHNRMGGYICSCSSGRILNNMNRCVDINECEYNSRDQVCPINSRCINTIGSYRCDCKDGFKRHYDNDKQCLDIDECIDIKNLCEQKCINFWGSYRCSCNPGYELNLNDNRTCSDINECEVHKSYNLCMGNCINIPGSYHCSCPPGYELGLDKNSCRDIDECSLPNICTGRNEICTNIRGSYRCTTIQCPYGYINDPDQKNRCKIITNICEGDECYQKPASYTYNFITLISKMLILPQGRTLFTLRGPSWYENIDFDLKIAKTQAPPNVEKATEQHFSTTKIQNQVQLSLMKSLEGPQDIELELSMTVFMNDQPQGKSIAKIIIIVSQYSF